jgi:hypothetical protein
MRRMMGIRGDQLSSSVSSNRSNQPSPINAGLAGLAIGGTGGATFGFLRGGFKGGVTGIVVGNNVGAGIGGAAVGSVAGAVKGGIGGALSAIPAAAGAATAIALTPDGDPVMSGAIGGAIGGAVFSGIRGRLSSGELGVGLVSAGIGALTGAFMGGVGGLFAATHVQPAAARGTIGAPPNLTRAEAVAAYDSVKQQMRSRGYSEAQIAHLPTVDQMFVNLPKAAPAPNTLTNVAPAAADALNPLVLPILG